MVCRVQAHVSAGSEPEVGLTGSNHAVSVGRESDRYFLDTRLSINHHLRNFYVGNARLDCQPRREGSGGVRRGIVTISDECAVGGVAREVEFTGNQQTAKIARIAHRLRALAATTSEREGSECESRSGLEHDERKLAMDPRELPPRFTSPGRTPAPRLKRHW